MIPQILAAIIALPKIAEDVKFMYAFLNGIFGDNFSKFSGDTDKLREHLEKLQSSEEARRAAKELTDIMSRIK